MEITMQHIQALRAAYVIGIDKYFEMLESKATNAIDLKKQADKNKKLDEKITLAIQQFSEQALSDNKPKTFSWVGGSNSFSQESINENF